jgi:hypothetical protein
VITNGVMFSIQECEIILNLINVITKDDYSKLTHPQFDMISQLRSIVRDDPIGTHIEQYHD